MDYKETLLLPQTDFPMRGSLPQNEPTRYAKWFSKEDSAYAKMVQNRINAPQSFILHDGPPYANGHIHIGHALNKILKDIIVKTHYFFGEKVRYVPGWDCHGLPIEQQVEKSLGKEKKDTLAKSKIRELCREHARKFIDIQRDEFKSLGVLGDWENPYMTMKFKFEADIYRALCGVADRGLLVERSKPVYWSWAARSALAEAEVEYEDKEDYSIFVAFKLSDEAKGKLDITADASIIIWTTTPWTLPANVGIAFSPEENYVLTSDSYIVAEPLHAKLLEQGVIAGKIVKTFKASILENSYALNPLNARQSQFVLGEHVTMDGGSGCVHTAPGHGDDDYKVGLRYNLEVVMPVDERGCYDETVVRLGLLPNAESFVGEHIFKSNERILELLGESLLKCSKFTHSYPFCWRTHQPIIYRATKQWFVAMDEATGGRESLRKMAMDELSKVRFYPKSGINRLGSMIENRPDWCISRQRDWGVPIAFFRDKATGKPIFDAKIVNHIANIFEEKGADAWWDLEIQDLLIENSGYQAENLEKVMDILDVWFDSGSTWKAVLESSDYDAGEYPASMYLEGSDQHRGWFQSSLLVSTANNGIAPYHKILTHGFTVDEKGEKMSKSKGNVVSPTDIAKSHGVEILRLWVGMSEYTTDLKISDNILKQISEQYRKIRNTFRFLLANVNDLETILPYEQMGTLDQWIVAHAKVVFDEAEAYFREYDFSKGFALLSHFITVELSGIYLDISKDRLYCNAKNDTLRLSAQSAMALVASRLMALMAPTLTYTIDEIMEYAPTILKGASKDVFDLVYTPLATIEAPFDEAYMMEAREKFFEIVDGLKKEKIIKSTLELIIQTKSSQISALPNVDAEDWFTVSKVINHDEAGDLGSFVLGEDTFKILKAAKCKCPRCWKFRAKSEDVLCHRCEEALNA
ncbi:MAG: isoleucine--tRNA ligase [Sulfurospirillaceae bacterium]|nr:isoleucine--tRNA ligase [Sulfurospirillaceae bacterium]MDD2827207.1 isoleucine--tRNA ligase [Sulfurospirillaceae bacterium]